MASQRALDGRVAVVTGAGRGIGAAVAHTLAAAGAHLVVTARSEAQLDELAEGIRRGGGGADIAPGDLTDPAFVDGLFDDVANKHGRLDILVNNAGAFTMPSLEEATPEDLRGLLDINTVAPWACMQRAVALMKQGDDDGHIVNIGSTQVFWLWAGDPGFYPATKVALRTLTLAVARQLKTSGSGIRISMVEPGGTNTSMVNPTGTPNSMLLEPEHVATAVLHTVAAPPGVHVFETTVLSQFNCPW